MTERISPKLGDIQPDTVKFYDKSFKGLYLWKESISGIASYCLLRIKKFFTLFNDAKVEALNKELDRCNNRITRAQELSDRNALINFSENRVANPVAGDPKDGVCHGSSHHFVLRVLEQTKEKGIVLEEAIKIASGEFVNGAPRHAVELQNKENENPASWKNPERSFYPKAYTSTPEKDSQLQSGSKMNAAAQAITIKYRGTVAQEETLNLSEKIAKLTDGIFTIEMSANDTGKQKGGSDVEAHTIVVIKSGKDTYLFDINNGTFKLSDKINTQLSQELNHYRHFKVFKHEVAPLHNPKNKALSALLKKE